MPTPRIALVIPAWNEAESIGAVLSEVPPAVVDRVLVVTGDSTDGTDEIATDLGAAALPQAQPGYGAACWAGVCAAEQAGAEIVVFLDGDYADPPAELPRVLAPLLTGQADVVLGPRDLAQHPEAQRLHARFGNWLVLTMLSLPAATPATRSPVVQGHPHGLSAAARDVRDDLRLDDRVGSQGRPCRPADCRGARGVPPATGRPIQGIGHSARHGRRGPGRLCTCALRYARWQPAAVPAVSAAGDTERT